MPFEIQWTGHQGAAMTHRDTPVEAIRFAIEMLGKDFTDVVIIDTNEGGKTYTLCSSFTRTRNGDARGPYRGGHRSAWTH